MGYTKVISYANVVETYEFQRDYIKPKRRSSIDRKANIRSVGEDSKQQVQSKSLRTKENARRTVLVFRRLVASNLGQSDKPILMSFTYAENFTDFQQAREDFRLFIKSVKDKFGTKIRYICVPEFQKRGAIHFHTLFWGLDPLLAQTERSTRLFAKFWGKGFVDVIQTDGSQKLSTYLAKYMAKAFIDERLISKKAYTCSRNLKRPVIDKNTMIMPYYHGYNGIDLSTALNLQDRSYDTYWLGKCRYRLFELNS